MNVTNKEIGARITTARERAGLNKKELAEKIGVADSTIKRYEDGEIKKIKIPVIESIANALSVNPMWIIGKSDNMYNYSDASIEDSISRLATYMLELSNLTPGKVSNESWNKIMTMTYRIDKAIIRSPELSSIYILRQDAILGLKEISQYLDIDWRRYNDSVFDEFLSSPDLKKFIEQNLELYQKKIDINRKFLVLDAAHERTDIETTNEMQKHDDDVMDDENF